MLKLNQIMVGSENPDALIEFYKKVLGEPTMVEDGWGGWKSGDNFFGVGPHSEVRGKNPNPGRVMWVFETKEIKEEFERIKATGAEVVKEPYQMEGMNDFWIATFSDPDGNYFQLMTPWEQTSN